VDRDALATDAKLYYSLFEIVDQAEARAGASATAASDPEVAAFFECLKEALRDAQNTHLIFGARIIIEAGEDEAVSCSG
jgi:hypothetical protein